MEKTLSTLWEKQASARIQKPEKEASKPAAKKPAAKKTTKS